MNIWKYFSPRWRVWAGDWQGGSVKEFWLKKNAIEYISNIESFSNHLFIDLEDRWKGTKTPYKSNPDNVLFLPMYK